MGNNILAHTNVSNAFFMLAKVRVKALSRQVSLWVQKLQLVAMVTKKFLSNCSKILRWDVFSGVNSCSGGLI